MKAFAGIPVLEQPAYSKEKKPRLFELRTYESHNAHMAQLKVEMFNKGEIDIMREVGLGPIFFGETLISNDVPNLTYMLSAENEEAHKTHWKGFGPHPEWQKLKKMPRYKGTVSKIISTMLAPTKGSQLSVPKSVGSIRVRTECSSQQSALSLVRSRSRIERCLKSEPHQILLRSLGGRQNFRTSTESSTGRDLRPSSSVLRVDRQRREQFHPQS